MKNKSKVNRSLPNEILTACKNSFFNNFSNFILIF